MNMYLMKSMTLHVTHVVDNRLEEISCHISRHLKLTLIFTKLQYLFKQKTTIFVIVLIQKILFVGTYYLSLCIRTLLVLTNYYTQ